MGTGFFHFKQFSIRQDKCPMKVNTDGVLLGSWVPLASYNRILDIGTGSGVIALMLAQRMPHAHITGVEIDKAASSQASENANESPWADRISILNQSIQDFSTKSVERFDLIISNPPYFMKDLLPTSSHNKRAKHGVELTFNDLIKSTLSLLTAEGQLCLILPYVEGWEFLKRAKEYELHPHQISKVTLKTPKPPSRLLLCLGYGIQETVHTELIVRDDQGQFTSAYQELTREFYLDF